MSRVPRWTRDATRPTADEIGRTIAPLDPRRAAWAREATRPTEAELARIRPRATPARGAPRWVWLGAFAGATALAAVGAGSLRPERVPGIERPVEAGVFVITAGMQAAPIAGVLARGEGVVRLVPGALRAEGDLVLTVDAPATIEHEGERFLARRAVIALAPGGLRVEAGELVAPDGILRAGERWPRAVATAPAPSPPPAPAAREPPPRKRAPAPAPAPVAPPPSPMPEVEPAAPADATAAWRAVLDTLERGGSAEERVGAIDRYLAAWPTSPFATDASALRLLLGAADDPEATLREVDRWLAAHADAPRATEIAAFGGRIARERLRDCDRAAPYDRRVAAAGGVAGQRATAFLGLCAIAAGRAEQGRALLATVDRAALDPALREAVARAEEAGP